MFTFMEMLTSLVPLFTAAAMIILGPLVKEHIPAAIRNYLVSFYEKYIVSIYEIYIFPPQLTLIIDPTCDLGSNEIYDAAEAYLPTKISDSSRYLKVSKYGRQEKPVINIVEGEVIIDDFEGIKLKWVSIENPDGEGEFENVFNLTFDKRFKDDVLESYLPYVIKCYKEILETKRVVNLHCCSYGGGNSKSIILEHPATFEKLAMNPELKTMVINDLNRFVKRKELYKKAGKPWKRGYLIYGPPGTGKSSLIAAIANYLKFDIYDLKFSEIRSDSDLRRILLWARNRSIIAIEDIDCGTVDKLVQGDDVVNQIPGPMLHVVNQIPGPMLQFTLSGLLNFVDGLWSSCGDERIIVLTTNHKDRLNKLDPALFRPGRVDMEVPMTYCTMEDFKLLASNYLDINDHGNFEKIEGLLKNKDVTAAEIAEILLRSDDKNVVLEGLIKFLEEKET